MLRTSDEARTSAAVHILDRFALLVGAIGVLAFTILVAYTVGARYLVGRTPFWSEELPRLLLIWVTFIGATAAFARNTHFEAGLLPLIVRSDRAQRVARLVASLASVIFLLILAKTGFDITRHTWGNLTTAMRWPVGLTYLALPVCCSLSAVAVVSRILSRN
ncbi:TRAP transporter small permease [Tianweitania sediminis]|jgi:TRAP-type C4-dicarboxylate transport system permease small subunit|uniref:TRAP transporter small permease protein n=1 Tax=Tianweitania sediminis TaxID=1502156 RepID=A0A8J7R551_9HYPH|nr:TRAP transporter small permease [Tianweitania sediminis]MBP0439990.1 TRAP transporter small permease [Tianweitania sediminis]HEV7415939.1 TRAP transporter small permease [Tianweitania sediminis]